MLEDSVRGAFERAEYNAQLIADLTAILRRTQTHRDVIVLLAENTPRREAIETIIERAAQGTPSALEARMTDGPHELDAAAMLRERTEILAAHRSAIWTLAEDIGADDDLDPSVQDDLPDFVELPEEDLAAALRRVLTGHEDALIAIARKLDHR